MLRPTAFEIEVPRPVLDDLSQRLALTRIADDLPADADDWSYGTASGFLADLVGYWRDGFDWRAQERRLNELDQVVADVDGRRLHAVHLPGAGDDPLPIVLAHGWPSGYLEMLRLAERLADPARFGGDPADAFHVVVPSFPGFGYSEPLPPGNGYAAAADVIRRFVVEGLGYDRLALHSTGAGTFVNGWIALEHPELVVGYHTHDPNLMPPPSFEPPAPPPSDAESAYRSRSARWGAVEGAYAALHRTKPQSLGHALTDSPAGLASWLVEKFRTWSDCDGDVTTRYSYDDLLTTVTWYWSTRSIASSIRMYYERVHHDPPVSPGRRLGVPTGVAMARDRPNFPPKQVPRETVERSHDVHHWVDLPSGGHFASWEEPDLVATSIRDFFRELR